MGSACEISSATWSDLGGGLHLKIIPAAWSDTGLHVKVLLPEVIWGSTWKLVYRIKLWILCGTFNHLAAFTWHI
jgi:hypothetical protein